MTAFSKKPDDLSQWRGYAQRPGGFSLGYDRRELEADGRECNVEFIDVNYDSATQAEEVAVLLKKTYREASEDPQCHKAPWNHNSHRLFYNRHISRFTNDLVGIAARSKHWAFADEAEVRAITRGTRMPGQKPPRTLNHRQSGSLVVPYVEWQTRESSLDGPLKHVLVGPGPHQEQLVEVTQGMCRRHVRVEASEIPFRNW